MRLSTRLLGSLPATVARPGYDRNAQACGIVHFGIGAFHRAHQAWYTDAAMALGDTDWAITGISLRSPAVADQLNPQDGLYTLTECSSAGHATRVIGSVHRVLVASSNAEAVIAAIAAPETRMVTFTITEKGYCRAADGALDPQLAHAGSVYAFLAQGLARRRDAGLPGLTLLSCDNLADNGRQLERLMRDYCARHAPDLAGWIARTCTFPCSMIDRIVPATTAEDREAVAAALGCEDDGAVMTEPFSQWVIENRFAGDRPVWDKVGAQIVEDVAPYETAKLRMLNGAHSAIAYIGLARGYGHVHEAIADPAIRHMAERLMLEEALPTIDAAPGQDLPAYAASLLERFSNPALNHRLIQIAMDGSQKIPQRWLETLEAGRLAGRSCASITEAMKAWFAHLRGANGPVDDPMAPLLEPAARELPDPLLAARLFTGDGPLAGIWQVDHGDLHTLLA